MTYSYTYDQNYNVASKTQLAAAMSVDSETYSYDGLNRLIGLECGGEPGRRLAADLGISTGDDTILRRLRSIAAESNLHPQTIGIDDFAFRKGHHYGTVIVDHKSGRVMDLLPERSSDSTADWLRA
jgi:hypothetical protein